jgi:hypothetical protein
MAETVILMRLDWDRTAPPGICPPGFYTTHVTPSDEHPYGRKGLVIASAWRALQTPPIAGLVILDGDVAIDPADRAAMLAAIEAEPKAVHVAPVKLWPVSTKATGWVWGHGRDGLFTRTDHDDPDAFGFGFTYLPRRLVLACIKAGMDDWEYPGVDRKAAATARRLHLPVRIVRDASPKHLNF